MAERSPVAGTPRSAAAAVPLAVLAVLGPWIYGLAVVLGGALWPEYSPYAETISTLTSAGAPHQVLLQPLFAIYNLALISLAWGLHRSIRGTPHGRWGPAFLGAAGVAGLVLFFFPQGPSSAPLSGLGVEHTIVAGLDALFFLLTLGFVGRRSRADPAWARFGTFTIAWLLIGIVLGGFGAASVNAPYAGLAERLSIGSFLIWTEVAALLVLRQERALGLEVRVASVEPLPR